MILINKSKLWVQSENCVIFKFVYIQIYKISKRLLTTK